MQKNFTPRERDTAFYKVLSGGANARLLESMLQTELLPLLADHGPLNAQEIADHLALHRLRARKWLVLLARAGLLDETLPDHGVDPSAIQYSASALSGELFGEDGRGGWFFREMVRYCLAVTHLDLAEVLRGMPMPETIHWPPQTPEAAEHLSAWMRCTADQPIQAVQKALNLDEVGEVLDVGGNDATMACAFAAAHPALRITLFDLPEAAFLARKNIAAAGLGDRVRVVEGSFLTDPLPAGFDLVIFSRTLTDWPPETVQMLLGKARAALRPGGRLLICEAFLDGNEDYGMAWEFPYVFYDDFGVGVFKPVSTYTRILDELGYGKRTLQPPDDDSFYSVLIAERD